MADGVAKAKYEQIRVKLERAVREGHYEVGSCLPPERELADRFKVSTFTVRQSLSLLQRDGIISRQRGRGTFVTSTHVLPVDPQPLSTRNVAYVCVGRNRYGEGVKYQREEMGRLAAHLEIYDRHMVYAQTSSRYLAAGKLPQVLEQDAVVGVFLDGYVQDLDVECLKNHGFSVVVLGNHQLSVPVSRVSTDDCEAAYLMTNALLGLDIGSIYFATEPFEEYYTHLLFAGYCRACSEAGQPRRTHIFSNMGDDIAELRLLIQSAGEKFGMLMHYNLAYALVDIYRECDLRLEDHPVAIFGYADFVTPETQRRLNVCTVDLELTSAVAVDLMERLIAGGEQEQIVLVPELSCSRENGLLHMKLNWCLPETRVDGSTSLEGISTAIPAVDAKEALM